MRAVHDASLESAFPEFTAVTPAPTGNTGLFAGAARRHEWSHGFGWGAVHARYGCAPPQCHLDVQIAFPTLGLYAIEYKRCALNGKVSHILHSLSSQRFVLLDANTFSYSLPRAQA